MVEAPRTGNLEEVLGELQRVAPDAPFLALGQTVFWDEPMKGGIALASRRLGYGRNFVAGVHDTDYFAKLPSGAHAKGRFQSFPHNDTTTKGLWSAAGEFSALFGSETVVTRDMLVQSGLNLAKIAKQRPDFLDEATEAWGWRGIVSSDEFPPITSQVPLKHLFRELQATFDWALELSLQCIAGQGREEAEALADKLRTLLCDHAQMDGSLAGFYEALLREFYAFAAGREVPLTATRTSELLRFNTLTSKLPRFDLVRLFVEPETRDVSVTAYNAAISGTGLYEASRFGTGAIPFDLVIPDLGRGTIRIGSRGIVIATHQPQFISISKNKPLRTLEDLAALIESKFGPDCVLIGKAVTLIGMLAREFVFLFHEGASSYVSHSRKLHQALAANGHPLELNPILRVKYDSWSALQVSCGWLRLPEPFQRPFAAEEVCSPSFASRWKQVTQEQKAVLETLGTLRRPIDLIHYLESTLGGAWSAQARKVEELHGKLESLKSEIEGFREQRKGLYEKLKSLKAERVRVEIERGDHFRARIFEQQPSEEDLKARSKFAQEIEGIMSSISETQRAISGSLKAQNERVRSAEVKQLHESRRQIEVEVEIKRLRLIRQAVISSYGLERANRRPSAWWFSLVSPDGLWFRQTVDSAECYLEPLN